MVLQQSTQNTRWARIFVNKNCLWYQYQAIVVTIFYNHLIRLITLKNTHFEAHNTNLFLNFPLLICNWHFKTYPESYVSPKSHYNHYHLSCRLNQIWEAVNFYDKTNSFKIVHNVTWTIVVAAISTHDCLQSWHLRPSLRSTSSVSNKVISITFKNIHLEVNIVNLWQIQAG